MGNLIHAPLSQKYLTLNILMLIPQDPKRFFLRRLNPIKKIAIDPTSVLAGKRHIKKTTEP